MTVKATELLDVVTTLAKEFPETQRECRYFNHDGTACCIVGEGLARLGVEPGAFLDEPDLNAWTPVDSLAERDWIDANDSLAMQRLYDIQRYQDKGWKWGAALTAAIEMPSHRYGGGDEE